MTLARKQNVKMDTRVSLINNHALLDVREVLYPFSFLYIAMHVVTNDESIEDSIVFSVRCQEAYCYLLSTYSYQLPRGFRLHPAEN